MLRFALVRAMHRITFTRHHAAESGGDHLFGGRATSRATRNHSPAQNASHRLTWAERLEGRFEHAILVEHWEAKGRCNGCANG
jgi:hypothetical protein